MEALESFLGTQLLEGKHGHVLRSTVGSLQSDATSFQRASALLLEKTSTLQQSVTTVSAALEGFSAALALMTGAQLGAEETVLWAPKELDALFLTSQAVHIWAGQMKILEAQLENLISTPLQDITILTSLTLQNALQEASDARLELESEGKKTAEQMAKQHELAAKGSDVSFGDLLKIQEPLKSTEKRFEVAASSHLGAMLKLSSMKRLFVGKLCAFQDACKAGVDLTASSFETASRVCDELRAVEVPQFKQAWAAEKGRREQAISQAVKESCFGTSNHVEGYLVATYEDTSGIEGAAPKYPALMDATKYFCAAQGKLAWFSSWSVYLADEELDLLLFTVRAVEGAVTKFQLQSPSMILHFQAPHERNRNKWVAVLAECIRERLDSAKRVNEDDKVKLEVLQRIRRAPGNATCADCDAAEPTWACLNYGVVICHQCSGVHRSLGSHVSKVRSLTLDVLEDETVDYFLSLGNAAVNALLERNLTTKKPSSASKRDVREEFIQSKYVTRAALAPDEFTDATECLATALVAGKLSVLGALELILQGANLKQAAVDGVPVLHALLESPALAQDPVLLTQLLVYNDCVKDALVGSNQERALHVAARRNFVASCRVLLRNGAGAVSLTSETKESPLDLLPAEMHPNKNAAPDIEAYLLPSRGAAKKREVDRPLGRSYRSSSLVETSPLRSSGSRLALRASGSGSGGGSVASSNLERSNSLERSGSSTPQLRTRLSTSFTSPKSPLLSPFARRKKKDKDNKGSE